MHKRTLNDLKTEEITHKRVLVRVDFNVPMKEGIITDDTRIRAALPTLEFLIKHQCKIILISHLGRPNGSIQESLRLTPVAKRVSELLNVPVQKTDDCIGETVNTLINAMEPRSILMLENIRFHPHETENNDSFSKELAKLADIFVQDAFGVIHRSHASTTGIAHYIPCYGGFLIEKELRFLDTAIQNPKRPFIAIIGGSKISTKITVLESLLPIIDTIVIGGAMTFTILKAQGISIGQSLHEDDKIEVAMKFLNKAKALNKTVVLPLDQVVVNTLDDTAPETVPITEIPDTKIGVDIGPKTTQKIQSLIKTAGTVLWNGPLGIFENPLFATGTFCVAESLAKTEAITIVGGGDSIAALSQTGLSDQMSHISTGGGATLAFLEGKELPGIKVMENK